MKQIVLIGFMGAGKTTIGQLLAQETGLPQYDFDELIVSKIGMSIADYFDRFGSEAFRTIETNILEESANLSGIISTGGGIVLKEKNREILKQLDHVIYLKADMMALIERVVLDKRNVRPLAESKSPKEIAQVYLPRVPLYEEIAKITIETTGRTPEAITKEILDKVGRP